MRMLYLIVCGFFSRSSLSSDRPRIPLLALPADQLLRQRIKTPARASPSRHNAGHASSAYCRAAVIRNVRVSHSLFRRCSSRADRSSLNAELRGSRSEIYKLFGQLLILVSSPFYSSLAVIIFSLEPEVPFDAISAFRQLLQTYTIETINCYSETHYRINLC